VSRREVTHVSRLLVRIPIETQTNTNPDVAYPVTVRACELWTTGQTKRIVNHRLNTPALTQRPQPRRRTATQRRRLASPTATLGPTPPPPMPTLCPTRTTLGRLGSRPHRHPPRPRNRRRRRRTPGTRILQPTSRRRTIQSANRLRVTKGTRRTTNAEIG
jgi:hypothetical protein